MENVVEVTASIIFLGRSGINSPDVINDKLVKYFLICFLQSDLLLPNVANFIQLLTFGPVIEGARDVNVVGVGMRPVHQKCQRLRLARDAGLGACAGSTRSYAQSTHHLKTKEPMAVSCV